MNTALAGWLFDIYSDPQDDLVIWLLEEPHAGNDDQLVEGRRLRLAQDYPIVFYISGQNDTLREVWKYLKSQDIPVDLSRTERKDFVHNQPVTVLAVQIDNPFSLSTLIERISSKFQGLNFFDTDIPLTLRYAATNDVLPLGKVRVLVDNQMEVQAIEPFDDPGEQNLSDIPLRIMRIEPDTDPRYKSPQFLLIQAGGKSYQLPVQHPRPLLVNLAALIKRSDPDLIMTAWGDSWLIPYLADLSRKMGIDLHLNRDEKYPFPSPKEACSGANPLQPTTLYGRWHLDMFKSRMFYEYGLLSILNFANSTGLPFQRAGYSNFKYVFAAVQMYNCLKEGTLVPGPNQLEQITSENFESATLSSLVFGIGKQFARPVKP